MKKSLSSIILLSALFISMSMDAAKPKKQAANPNEFRRSSLTMIMMEDPRIDTTIQALVKEGFRAAHVPDKFDEFDLGYDLKIFDPMEIEITDAARTEFSKFSGKKKSKGSKGAKGTGIAAGLVGLVGNLAGFEMGPTEEKYQNPTMDTTKSDRATRAYLYLKDNHVAKRLMDKWFEADSGRLSIDLIKERAFYNATPEEKAAAQEQFSERKLMDAVMDMGGIDMISNTFVTVSSFRYMTAEDMSAEILNGAAIGAAFLPRDAADLVMSTAELSAVAATVSIGKGYCINSTTYLYKLVWNDEIWKAIQENCASIEAYNRLDCFHLEYVGESSAYCQVAVGRRTFEEAVSYAVSRSMAKVIAKLEKENEVFRTVTPLTGIDPEITASIGTKECVEKGDKYDVLMNMGPDEKTGLTTYKKVGSLKVETVGNNMGEDNDDKEAASNTYTTFKGKLPKTAQPGTLIRQAN